MKNLENFINDAFNKCVDDIENRLEKNTDEYQSQFETETERLEREEREEMEEQSMIEIYRNYNDDIKLRHELTEFELWKEDNVVTIKTVNDCPIYSTQDALYRNRLKGDKALYDYFVKEFRC